MAKKKTQDDLTWEQIFSSISFEIEPPVKYIKDVLIRTKTGRRIRLTGREFVAVMEQERQMDPEHAMIQSCRVTLDFEKIKGDIDRFAVGLLKKSSSRYKKSRAQTALAAQLKKLNPPAPKKPGNPPSESTNQTE